MGVSSWLVLGGEDPEHALAEAAGQAGLVSQLRPLIRELSKPDDLVFDPFAGWGTTLVAASVEGRRGFGIEVNAERAEDARRWLRDYPGQEMYCGDARKPPLEAGSVDLVLCDLPYFGTNLDTDAMADGQFYALREYDDYLGALDEAFAAIALTMRPGANAVIAVQNRRIADRFVPLAWDAARVLGRHLTLGDERIHLYDRPASGDDPMRTNRSHEYLLMATK
ncbi:DNA methyltransferase [Kitasatospora sp. MAP5-34]|uniref:TRM11 family SAM-dependent methyltransferase n=1 Tax=Kitasatospora sp. MAP5-34 TaxID=3035102 RepID=UPI0024747528|nr:DNA methyltransferase [Kitasatospora sp. MAP5-34]MDH6577344.1 DNA modification methylase [Kitasatospora sp. MAP5-34]